jgi:hypothetical protein
MGKSRGGGGGKEGRNDTWRDQHLVILTLGGAF